MIPAHSLLGANVAERVTLLLIASSHGSWMRSALLRYKLLEFFSTLLEIAREYGNRLASRSQNLAGDQLNILEHLISHYPSHGFIIDYGEAKRIFKNVRIFTADEVSLMKHLGTLGRWPARREEDQFVGFISTQIAGKTNRGGQAHAKQQKSGSANKSRGGKRAAAAAAGAGPSIIAQIPALAGSKQP